MVIEAAVAVIAGSLLLVAFGIDSAIELASAIVVFRRFQIESRAKSDEQALRNLLATDFAHLPQSQLFPQLHSLLSFMGQFFPVFLQLGLSAANAVVQINAARIENRLLE